VRAEAGAVGIRAGEVAVSRAIIDRAAQQDVLVER
jgi:hypothetical protein